MSVIQHEWRPTDERCIHCGTPRALQDVKAQNCVPRWQHGEPAPWRATHTGRSVGDFAADDADTIQRRLVEIEAERIAAINRPEE